MYASGLLLVPLTHRAAVSPYTGRSTYLRTCEPAAQLSSPVRSNLPPRFYAGATRAPLPTIKACARRIEVTPASSHLSSQPQ
ncbi:hypothetical protein EJ06DRAFT_533239 [Trichodelitschia bisporula]|uniref:Uncharacterized protein n=1 Tax=Trichodelitschia bisporula TaxID=703511 RepID=A0A6G1HLZ6_9PEZI|nr:hypothetical protein EJ06DRAFT_533239 [Trichodelitschia bisporula]